MEKKLFIGFGIVTILSGIYFITQGDYIQGVCGVAVGLLLVFLNFKKSA